MLRYVEEKLQFPKEAIQALEAPTAALLTSPVYRPRLFLAMEQMLERQDLEYRTHLQAIADESGISFYTMELIFLLLCTLPLRYRYAEQGISEEIYWNTFADLKYKLVECKDLHGIWGTFVGHWYPRFFRMELFALGRLQYECKPFPLDSYKDLLVKDELVCKCHIPSSGPLLAEDVVDSLKQAYDFFKDFRKDGILPVICNSWLFYPPTSALFKKGSNMETFYRMFEVIHTKEQEDNADFWRIFSLPFSEENLRHAPEDSSLRRNIKQFLLEGNKLGNGLGILLFDGERILTWH
ncbi:MAG: DUF5596 domain-containing protein [Clostridia bacterium]|nr:DUF5596 domain-containing protein [Clostridia bacterium]